MASIHKLPPDVINRIAAGEVVQRPSAALKELLENAIDADCSRVQVLAADGGLEVLQVSDDGSGIHKEDLPLLCERYATSKLQSFDDLHHVTSFGFRGEALASISYVSRVTVTTRRRPPAPSTAEASSAAQVAWRAQYLNGSLTSDPQPCAGNPGTTIRAEKLFYNALVRRNSLRASEEWGRIVDVVSRYALAYPKIGFTCQRDQSFSGSGGAGSSAGAGGGAGGAGGGAQNGNGVNFPANSSTRHNIRLAHGSTVASHLRLVYAYETGGLDVSDECMSDDVVHVKKEIVEAETTETKGRHSSNSTQQSGVREAQVFAQMERRAHRVRSAVGPAGEGLFTLIGYTSDPTLAQRKPYLCLFINQRLVESSAIRKAIDSVYSGVLTGGNRPFTVLLLTVPTDRIDVNVHPTKKEVFLLDEELVVARVSEVCRGAVLEAAAARQMDMLKMRHTTALALKQLPVADGSGGADSAASEMSGSSSQHILEKLRDQHRRGVPVASPLTSSSPAVSSSSASAGAAAGGGPAVVVAPCTMVRVEPQRGALDRYFSQRLSAADGSGAVASPASSQQASTQDGRGRSERGGPPFSQTAAFTEVTNVDESSIASGKGDDDATPTGPPQQQQQQRQHSSSPAYAAPSWDAVMASLHRAAASDGSSDGRVVPAVSTPIPSPLAPTLKDDTQPVCAPTQTTSLQVERENAEESEGESAVAGQMRQTTSSTAEGVGLKSERNLQTQVRATNEPARALKRRSDGESSRVGNRSSSSDGDASSDEEDRMREFKRHRRDVYERVEAMQQEDVAQPFSASNVVPDGVASEKSVVKPETDVQSVKVDDTEEGSSTLQFKRSEHVAADEEQKWMRLGAVVQAADLMREEATAAAREASAFSHVVASSEEEVEEGKESGRDGRTTTTNATQHVRTAEDGAAASLVSVAEVAAPAILSSVSIVVDRILTHSSPSAASLTNQLTYVGTVDARAFLAQVGTSLVWCDTMRLVRHVVFQRIFLRWGQPALPAPAVLEFDVPLPLSDLLSTALACDVAHLQPPSAALLAVLEKCEADALGTSPQNIAHRQPHLNNRTASARQQIGTLSTRSWRERLFHVDSTAAAASSSDAGPESPAVPPPRPATRQYIRRLVRRLCRWRGLLQEYFFINITDEGLLCSVPYGLNRHWPPLLRALPLTMWRLAEDVPYPTPQADTASMPRSSTDDVTPSLSATSTPAATQNSVEAEADGVAQEVECFTAVARHLADTLYGLQTPPAPTASSAAEASATEALAGSTADEAWQEELVQHGLFPCLKNTQLFRLPDQCLRDGTVQSMVSVESLYKVFERC